jgi:hypothetical protein
MVGTPVVKAITETYDSLCIQVEGRNSEFRK